MEEGSLGKTYSQGEVIVEQGAEEDCMYVIQSGQVEVVQDGEVTLAILGRGDFFGEMALFQRESRAATVQALGNVRVLTIEKRTLLRRIQEDPSLAFSIIQKLSQRVRDLNQSLAQPKSEA